MLQNNGPARIIIELTNRCNLDCSICLRRSWHAVQGKMDGGVFSKLITDLGEFASAPEVFFGGYGEPLSHPNVLAMISQAAAIGSRTALITNGTLLTPHLIDALVESGLDKLWISADSSHQEAFIQSPSQENQPVLMDLLPELFISGNGSLQKLETGLALVLTRDNQAEILEIIDQGQSLGLSSFYLTYLEAYTQYQASQLPYSLEELRRQGTRQIRADNMLPKIKAMTGKNPGLSIEGVVTKNQDRCPFAERGDLVLRWDGEISPCLPLLYTHTTHIESWEYKQFAFSLGNILDHSIPEIWEDKEYSRLQERLLHNEFSPCLGCRDCWFSQDNLQDCMGFDHPACGGCLWAAGLVSCP